MAQKRPRAAYEADLQAQQSPYVLYGTPLPPKDPSVRDDGSYVPIWKQEVRDERGRKRLHGAFTGGYSAGYFNTVGSKEGWTPSSFVSSRSKRNQDAAVQQRPEDFMDEEDLAEQEESRNISMRGEFSGLGSTADEVPKSGTVMDLFRPNGETMGTKLLQKMGWREGQGIGPKVWRRARGDADDGEMHLFAPEDIAVLSFQTKHDHKGLGFEGESKLSATAASKSDSSGNEEVMFSRTTKPSKKPAPQKGGIGLGVLNDDGSDDDDPFSMGPRLSYNRVVGGKDKDKRKKKKLAENRSSRNANPTLHTPPVFSYRRGALSKALRKCHDGRLPPAGFLLASDDVLKSLSGSTKFSPPQIPEGWVSSKTSRSAARSSGKGEAEPLTYQSTSELARSSRLDPSSRGALLGESKLPGKSVFSYLTPSARDKLATLTSKPLPAGHSETLISNDPESLEALIPALDASIASAALGRGVAGFVPYADDPPKLARYRAFLAYRAGTSTAPPSPPSQNSTPAAQAQKLLEEWARELAEFAHAATIFKPMTGGMASRFTAASTRKDAKTGPEDDSAADDGPITKIDSTMDAAKMGMFGPMTRSQSLFFPTRLLCKRFGVPVPAHGASDEADARARKREEGRDAGSARTAGPTTADTAMDAEGRVSSQSAGDAAGPVDPASAATYSSRFASAGFQVGAGKESKIVEQIAQRPGGLSRAPLDPKEAAPAHDGGLLSDDRVAAMAREAGYAVPEPQELETEYRDVIDPDVNEATEMERPGDELFRAVFGDSDEE